MSNCIVGITNFLNLSSLFKNEIHFSYPLLGSSKLPYIKFSTSQWQQKNFSDLFTILSNNKLSSILKERSTYSEKDGSYEHVTLSRDGIIPKTERYNRDFLVSSENKKYKITKMGDISLIDKTITIQRTVQRIYDKVKGTSYVYIGAPKTASSARTIPLPSLLVNIIKKYYTDSPNQYFLTGKNKPTEPRTYRQFFARFLKKHNLRNVKFHEIRHTFAVRAIEIPEFDVKSLSEILGHKNVSFTLNVYGRANMQQKIKCMNLLNDLL